MGAFQYEDTELFKEIVSVIQNGVMIVDEKGRSNFSIKRLRTYSKCLYKSKMIYIGCSSKNREWLLDVMQRGVGR